jgi:hypothetical protein
MERARKRRACIGGGLLSLTTASPVFNPSGLTNLRGFKELKDFVMSLEKPR